MGARTVTASGLNFPLIEEVLEYVENKGAVHPRCDAHYWHQIMENGLVKQLDTAGKKWELTTKGKEAL